MASAGRHTITGINGDAKQKEADIGDSQRFDAFADFISGKLDKRFLIADVASGKGLLRESLRRRGYKMVDCFDKRNGKSGLFHWDKAPGKYDAVVAMHPDESTDATIMYALKHRVPFLVVPCCIKPSATTYKPKSYHLWLEYLTAIGESGNMRVAQSYLSIRGCNIVLSGVPNDK